MGMSATQANLLFLTSRLHDVENAAQFIEGEKIALATQQDEIYQTYCAALDATKIQVAFNSTGDGKRYFVDATYENVCMYDPTRCKQYSLTDAKSGKLFVTSEMKEAYEHCRDDKYSFAWEMLELQGNWNGNWYNTRTTPVSVADNGCALTDVEELVYRKHAEGFGNNPEDVNCSLNNLYEDYINTLCDEEATNDDKLEALFNFREALYSSYGNDIYGLMKLDKQAGSTPFPGFYTYIPSKTEEEFNNDENLYAKFNGDYDKFCADDYQNQIDANTYKHYNIGDKCEEDIYDEHGNKIYTAGATVENDISKFYDVNGELVCRDDWYLDSEAGSNGRQIFTYKDFEDYLRTAYLGQEDSYYKAFDKDGNIIIDKLIGDSAFPKSEFDYYVNMWQSITNAGGCTEVPISAQKGDEANAWFNDMVKSGRAIINVYNETTKEWGETNVATSVNVNFLQENQDETDLKKAEAEYEYQLSVIEKKDTELDRQLSKLETERNSIKQIMESSKTIISDNIDKTFNIFG